MHNPSSVFLAKHNHSSLPGRGFWAASASPARLINRTPKYQSSARAAHQARLWMLATRCILRSSSTHHAALKFRLRGQSQLHFFGATRVYQNMYPWLLSTLASSLRRT